MNKFSSILAPALLCLGATATAAEWAMDPAQSRLEFIASYTGSDLPGAFREFDVELGFEPADPADARLVVTVNVASADMGDADMNEAVAGEIWLAAALFGTARFASEDIVRLETGEYAATGTLELKGVTVPVTVPFAWREDGDRSSMSGELVLQRLDFGIGTGTWTATDEVAGEVLVRFDVAFAEQR